MGAILVKFGRFLSVLLSMAGGVVCSDGRDVFQDVTITQLVLDIWPGKVRGEIKKIVATRMKFRIVT